MKATWRATAPGSLATVAADTDYPMHDAVSPPLADAGDARAIEVTAASDATAASLLCVFITSTLCARD